jgi:hypothetical protein
MRERSAILGISFYPGILKDRRERSASAVRERIRPALAIMSDESPLRSAVWLPRALAPELSNNIIQKGLAFAVCLR